MLKAEIEYIGHLRSDGFKWALRTYGQKGWYIHNGMPSLYMYLEDAEEAKKEFLS